MSDAIRHINPPSLPKPFGFTHVTVGPAQQIAFISGQVSCDAQGNIVGPGDLAKQTRQVLENLSAALASVNATFNDVLKFTFFVKDLTEESVATIRHVRKDYLPPTNPPASTLIGVPALVHPALLLEVEAYVAVPAKA